MTAAATGSRVLVVEDSATQAAALAELLTRTGYEAVTARRADHALTILGEQHIDLVLSDVLMPGMDGYELTKRIRAMPELNSLPVVLLTSLTDPLAIVRGLESGADHYVTKPYEPAALLARVRTVLEKADEPRLHSKPFTVDLLGTPFTISATKEKILELLVSSYSDLVRTSEAVRDAERRARFLAEAAELLSSSLDVHHVLRDLARLIVPRIADICTADLLTSVGTATRNTFLSRILESASSAAIDGADAKETAANIQVARIFRRFILRLQVGWVCRAIHETCRIEISRG